MSPKVDLTGQRFGLFTVLREGGRISRKVCWICRCDCGVIKEVAGQALTTGHTKSCGCLKSTVTRTRSTSHGLRWHYLYRTWSGIISRTANPTNPSYRNYGARGIRMCDEWVSDPGLFIRWVLENLGDRPPGKSLDRIDNDDWYRPGNVKWSTASEQRRNQRIPCKGKV